MRPALSLSVPSRVRIVEPNDTGLVLDDGVVDASAAAADQPARLAVRGGEPGPAEQFEGRYTTFQLISRYRNLWQPGCAGNYSGSVKRDGRSSPLLAYLKDRARSCRRRLGRLATVAERRRLGRQALFSPR